MTTNELIEALRKADPEGTTPACINNEPIISVHKQPAYWDGKLQELVTENGKYVSGRLIQSGDKVTVCSLSIADAVEYGDIELDVSDLSKPLRQQYLDAFEKNREKAANFRRFSIYAILKAWIIKQADQNCWVISDFQLECVLSDFVDEHLDRLRSTSALYWYEWLKLDFDGDEFVITWREKL